jgi:hypothetical protein
MTGECESSVLAPARDSIQQSRKKETIQIDSHGTGGEAAAGAPSNCGGASGAVVDRGRVGRGSDGSKGSA